MGRPKLRTADVRDDALRCALDLLEQEGPPAVSARRVAASAGTSTAALYEFFGDKAGLLRAAYGEGFAALRDALDAVERRRRPPARARGAARRRAALRARERPMLFELMYSRPFAEFSPGPADRDAAVGVYRTIVGARCGSWLRAAGHAASATEAAHVLVAAHRGFVMTELAGIAGNSRASIDARYRRGVDAVLDGLLATSEVAP